MSEIKATLFRRVMARWATGVTVITALDEGAPTGMACNSFTSVSLDPPLVGFFPATSSTTYPRIRAAGTFCVNILRADQHELCRQFAASGVDRFAGVSWTPAKSGAPILDDAVAWIDCRIVDEVPAGDHMFVLGRTLGLGHTENVEPLVLWGGTHGRFVAERLRDAA